jgi:hypothetical protein
VLFASSATCPMQISPSRVNPTDQHQNRPKAKRVITDEGSYTTDYPVVALGADITGMPRPALPR